MQPAAQKPVAPRNVARIGHFFNLLQHVARSSPRFYSVQVDAATRFTVIIYAQHNLCTVCNATSCKVLLHLGNYAL